MMCATMSVMLVVFCSTNRALLSLVIVPIGTMSFYQSCLGSGVVPPIMRSRWLRNGLYTSKDIFCGGIFSGRCDMCVRGLFLTWSDDWTIETMCNGVFSLGRLGCRFGALAMYLQMRFSLSGLEELRFQNDLMMMEMRNEDLNAETS